MNIVLKYLPPALNLAVMALGINVVSNLYREYRQAKLLHGQMEEDHATLVKKVIEVNNTLHNANKDDIECIDCGSGIIVKIGVDPANGAAVYECGDCQATWEIGRRGAADTPFASMTEAEADQIEHAMACGCGNPRAHG